MKFSSQNLKQLIGIIQQNQCKSLLFYGYNHGLITTIIKQITNKENFLISTFNIKEINATELNILANRTNFFRERELIKLVNVSSTVPPPIQKFLTEQNYANFICLISDDNLPPNGIRKIYEKHPNLASIACYPASEIAVADITKQYARKYGKLIDREDLSYLTSQLKGDNQLIKSELEKIFIFHHDQEKIDRVNLENILSSDLSASADLVCIYFSQKKLIEFLSEIDKLLLQNYNEILILRILAKYLANLYLVKKQIIAGGHIETALKSLQPPIFFKYIAHFKKALQDYSIGELVKNINYLHRAEAESKKNSANFCFFKLYKQCHLN